jgi:L-ascorbate metabolism protein UlaG (beta-lactamase superfamily)
MNANYFPKKIFLAIISLIFLTSLQVFTQETLNVTHIANAGFLIESGSDKVLIDGIFYNVSGKFYTPSAETLESERLATVPFDDIDVYLNSHLHADHIDKDVALEHLSKNPAEFFVSTKQFEDSLNLVPGYDTLKKRIRLIEWTNHSRLDTTINGIELKTYSFTHANGNIVVQNIGYLMTLNGFKVFDSGDSDPNISDTFQLYNLGDESIDLAILHRGFFDAGDNSVEEQIMNYLQPKAIIIMHIKIGDYQLYRQNVAAYAGIPKVYFMEEECPEIHFYRDGDSLKTEENSGINEVDDNDDSFQIFPNPSNGKFTVNLNPNLEAKQIEVFSSNGQRVFCNPIGNLSTLSYDFSAYPKGVYIIEIKTSEGIEIKKMCLQ